MSDNQSLTEHDFSFLESAFDDALAATTVPEKYGHLIDGKYACKLEAIKLKKSEKKQGVYYIQWEFIVMADQFNGSFINNKFNRFTFLNTGDDSEKKAKKMQWLRQDLQNAGYVWPAKISLPGAMASEIPDNLIGNIIEIQVAVKDDYQGKPQPNYYVNGKIDNIKEWQGSLPLLELPVSKAKNDHGFGRGEDFTVDGF